MGSHLYTKAALAALAGFALVSAAHADEFEAPASYYSGATGTGATLKSQLTSAMSAGHIQRSYGDFRNASRYFDTDPNNPSRILLCYTRASVSGSWDSGSTWNREHVWPQSLQPGSASNSSRGNLGDPHALRPCDPSTNSSRGNKPFGLTTTTGSNRSLGTYYFTGDTDKGDIARSLFYSDTRWTSQGISLVNGTPSSNRMGDLGSLIVWNYLDAPDTFERRRNHAIYSSSLNPTYYTNNRNAYIDMPWVVWSIYVDQLNNSRLWVGSAPGADGSSSLDIAMNTIVGVPFGSVDVTLNKDGTDGTYFGVETSAGIESSISGKYNAFAMNTSSDSRTMTLSAAAGTEATSGVSTETVVFDNLDITTNAGSGMGANDADDTVTVTMSVYEPFNATVDAPSDSATVTVDLGRIALDGGDALGFIELGNIGSGSLVAPMDAELLTSTGDTGAFVLAGTSVTDVAGGATETIQVTLDDGALGVFNASYTFVATPAASTFSFTTPSEFVTVQITGEVAESVCDADFASPYGQLDFFDLSAFLTAFGNMDPRADFTDDGTFDFFDLSAFLDAFGAGCP